MSHSSSPNNRGSIFGWAKSLKRSHLLSNESVNDISDNDSISRSPTKLFGNNINHNNNNNNNNLNNLNNNNQSQPHSPLNIPNNSNNNRKNSYDYQPQQQPQQESPTFNQQYLGTSPTTSTTNHSDFLRPLLNHKSRSTNNVSRVRSNSLNQSENSLRQHRDSFLQSNSLVDENSKYFGVPLQQALNEACAKISILTGDQSDGLQYGQIPIVVAKCGVFLKKNGLTVEGIFRVGGSSRRLKDLQVIFNTPPTYGKKLNWDGYTVHDAASILRRYLNALPEPLIPLNMYDDFRDPLKNKSRIISYMKYKAENPSKNIKTSSTEDVLDSTQLLTEANMGRLNGNDIEQESKSESQIQQSSSSLPQQQSQHSQQPQSSEEDLSLKNKKKSKNYKKLTRDVHSAIEEYKILVNELPNASKQLLFYILDLLAMVQNHSKENLMSSRNLAAIFQPSILSHPNHDLDPDEYALSQLVVEFLIQYAYKLLPTHTMKISPPAPPQQPQNNSGTIESDVTSTSTTPLEGPPSIILETSKAQPQQPQPQPNPKPQPPKFSRRHSKSLSSAANHDDMVVGYQSNVTGSIPFDSDMDCDLSDENEIGSDVDDLYFQQLKLNNGGEISPIKKILGTKIKSSVTEEPEPVAIVVTAPSTGSIPKVENSKI
ncbi:SAC7 [Candida jiufengensis]|uniref:SAC7 n=1 Tax=Candida jiufengensis TaxID=497108 RepID=UPI00222507B6|nr:SAC7 [Candida jiufengensis]KAI5950099.1 SAC7 [Candida jiufengensis]